MDSDLEEQQLIDRFIDILKQETLSPEVLPFDRRVFENLHLRVKLQESRIKQYIEPDQTTLNHDKSFKFMIYKSETERLNYLLKEYLRIRLRKIENFAFHLFRNQAHAEKVLSDSELAFMKKYGELKYHYLEENILKKIKNYRGLGGLEVFFTKGDSKPAEVKLLLDTKQSRIDFPEPNFESYVFALIETNQSMVRLNYDMEAVNVEGQPVLSVGSIIYAHYRLVAPLVKEGNARLI